MSKHSPDNGKKSDINHYQKLLIPLNIFVCILCLVSIFTLMFAPILKINVGKIVSSPEVNAYVKDAVLKTLNKGGQNGESSIGGQYAFTVAQPQENGGDENGNNAVLSEEMMATIATAVIDPLLNSFGKHDISLSFTAMSAMNVLTGGSEAFKQEISSIVTTFADDLITAVLDLFKNDEIIDAVVDVSMPAMIKTSIDSFKNDENTSQEVKDLLNDLSDEDIDKITENLKALKDTHTPDEFVEKLSDVAPDLMLILTGQKIDEEQKEALKDEIKKMVDAQVEAVNEQYPDREIDYNLEAFICIRLSQSMDLENLDKTIKDMISGGNTESSVIRTTAEKVEDGDTPATDETPNETPNGNPDGETAQSPNKIYVSFNEVVGSMENTQDSIADAIRSAINKALDDFDKDLDTYAQIYGMLFVFMAAFAVLWFILFLFAFIHIFTKNKRFMTWYVKLLCWIPGIIWLALIVVSSPSMAAMVASMIGGEISASMITAVLGGLSSWGTGVSYICYWLLWIVSIFWAFPIKHKIRKLKKESKRGEA